MLSIFLFSPWRTSNLTGLSLRSSVKGFVQHTCFLQSDIYNDPHYNQTYIIFSIGYETWDWGYPKIIAEKECYLIRYLANPVNTAITATEI